MLDLQFGQASDPGKIRPNNEDSMGAFIPASPQQARTHGYLFAVADGVGGLDFDEIASFTAVSVLIEEFEKAEPGAMLIGLLPRLIHSANAALHERSLAPESDGKKIATTLVACAIRHDQAVVSHVGGSRCYLIRNGYARQITQDHTWLNEEKKTGTRESADVAPEAQHPLTSSLGLRHSVSPDTTALTLLPGDVLVLCTDGLHDETSNLELARIASQPKSADQIARELVAHAVKVDGQDNATAQVIRVRSVEQLGVHRPYPLTGD